MWSCQANSTVATSSIQSAGRRLTQTDENDPAILANPPVEWANPGPVPGNPANATVTANQNVFSVSSNVSGSSVGFPLGQQVIVSAQITATGSLRYCSAPHVHHGHDQLWQDKNLSIATLQVQCAPICAT